MSKILVIDDEKPCLTLLQVHLSRQGYEVVTAQDGNAGLKILGEGPVDLVITDVIMPGKDGLETIRDIRKNWPGQKIIAMSGGGMCGTSLYASLCRNLGAELLLKKPFSSEEMLRVIASQLPPTAPGTEVRAV